MNALLGDVSTRNTAVPVCLAKRVKSAVDSRSWATAPGADCSRW